MAAMKDYTSVEDYLNDQPDPTRQMLKELRASILKGAPEAKEQIKYKIPGYGLKEGAHIDNFVMMAGYKSHVSFYPHPTAIEAFKEELANHEVGKGTVQFSLSDPLPTDLITRMVKYRVKALQDA